ncbi:DUF3533 domain-containing protein [Planosporangium flavigriseum]|uniref:DUF3533 domain-containing protein n=1 Tax=Planosporangium flavigriseum TaxID=373681 RepID=A0A8J3LPP7_9ACTN|nr:DUF3533 domain-containing protein [Planosporangium flavigriseum]NJC66888.1 DUF3533 domain-containing protein [Planosporangium flavigriseum]GIG74368.1 hypothetical protein Pfl04_27720 [Planosporangium flavigriseum]
MPEQPARTAYRVALVIITIGTVMASTFVASYTIALGRPEPRRVPTGLVGEPAAHPALIETLQEATGGGLAFHPYPSAPAAAAAIGRQQISAALVLGPGRPQLLIASASGASLALVLERAAERVNEQLAPESAPPLRIVDVRPLPPNDPLGLNSFYVAIAATVLGFVTMFQLRQHAPGLSLRAWLASIGVLAAGGGLALALVTGPLLHALPAPLPAIWAGIATQITVAALFNSTMLVLFGRWAIIPTWLMFIAFGNAWSGGAVAPPLLPRIYAFVGRFMPSGAAVAILHNLAYFRGAPQVEPFVVQACWLVGLLVALVISVRVKRRRPTGRPVD